MEPLLSLYNLACDESAHTLCLIGHITLSPFSSPHPQPPHYRQCAPPLQASPPPLGLICPLFFSTDSVWEDPISICWQFMAALKIKHDTVENGTQSQSFKSPVHRLAFCKNKKNKTKTKPVVGLLCLVLLITRFTYFFCETAKEMSGADSKYRLTGRGAEKKKKKSFIDPTVGKFAEICCKGVSNTG